MRKKLWHKRINPENKEYDRFYIVNYLEPGKTWTVCKLNVLSPIVYLIATLSVKFYNILLKFYTTFLF